MAKTGKKNKKKSRRKRRTPEEMIADLQAEIQQVETSRRDLGDDLTPEAL